LHRLEALSRFVQSYSKNDIAFYAYRRYELPHERSVSPVLTTVNAAVVTLGRSLLVKGEPGTGKT
jgi:MoxR-like ATPase